MICPTCGHAKDKVIDSRQSNGVTRRRRSCLQCTTRFTTYELTSDALDKISQAAGMTETIQTIFNMLDMVQEIARKELKTVQNQLPTSYLKLKAAKLVEQKSDDVIL